MNKIITKSKNKISPTKQKKTAKTFSILNYKGGTGKTCTLVNLAHAISQKNYRVLIIDTDPQGSTSYHLGVDSKNTLYDVITNNKSAKDCVISARKNLDIIVSNERLFPAEHYMHQQKKRELTLKRCLTPILNSYDYIFIDCSPAMTLMNQNVLLFTQNIIIPVSMEYMTLLGVKQLMNNVSLLNKMFNSSIKISKIVPTFFNHRSKKTKNVYQSLARVFPSYLSSPIHVSISISEASGQGKTIYEYNSSNQCIYDFNKLSEEVINL